MPGKSKTKFIRGMLRAVTSQRLQYKPYGYELDFMAPLGVGHYSDRVVVELEIPFDTVVEEGEGYVVVSLDGLNAILEVTADSLDKLDIAYKKKIQGG